MKQDIFDTEVSIYNGVPPAKQNVKKVARQKRMEHVYYQ